MRRPLIQMTGAAAAAAIVLAGCGGGSGGAAQTQSKDPKAAFTTGVSGVGDSDALTVTLKLETTASDLERFSKDRGDKLTAQQAQAIATAAVVIEAKTSDGTKLSDVKPGSTSKTGIRFEIQDNGQSLAELRGVDNALYAKADLRAILTAFGKQKSYSDLTARAASLPAFVKAFVQGNWVSLDLNALKSLAGQLGAGAAASPNAQQGQKLLNDLKAVLGRDVTVARVGTDDQGDHLRATMQSRQFVTDLMQTVTSDIPSAGAAANAIRPSSVPDHSIVLDAWVKDGALAKLSLDLAQFAKPGEAKAGDHLPVVLQFDRSGDDISKPSGAVPVDTSQLFTMLGALGSK